MPTPVADGDVEVGVEVAVEGGAPGGVVEEREGGEVGQVEALVEDERRLDPAVGEEDAVRELRQVVAVGRHGRSPCGRGRVGGPTVGSVDGQAELCAAEVRQPTAGGGMHVQ